MIRSADQRAAIEKLGHGQPGKLSVLVSSVEDVQTESDAKKILDQVNPDWVVWSAGESSCDLEIKFARVAVASRDMSLHVFDSRTMRTVY